MTNTGRESVALVLIAIQLLFFMGLGGAATAIIAEITKRTTVGDGSTGADVDADDKDSSTKMWLSLGLNVLNIYIVSVVQAIFMTVLMMLYGPAAEKGGNYVKGVAVSNFPHSYSNSSFFTPFDSLFDSSFASIVRWPPRYSSRLWRHLSSLFSTSYHVASTQAIPITT